MSKTIDTLVPDILALFDGHSVTEGVHGFAEKVGQVFIDRLSEKEHQSRKLYLSQIGKPLRKLWYELTGAPSEKLSAQAKLKFAYGDLLEEMIIFLAVEAGHKVERLQERVSIDGVNGKIDCIIDGVLIDVKSCSSQAFLKFKFGKLFTDDAFGYVYQLSSYWAMLPEIKRAAFLAVDKETAELCLLELKDGHKKSKDDVRDRIAEIRKAVDSSDVPERCYEPKPEGKSGNMRLGVGCSWCGHKSHCWSDANEGEGIKTYFYSNGPKYLVKIVREPKVSSSDDIEEETTDIFPVKKEQ